MPENHGAAKKSNNSSTHRMPRRMSIACSTPVTHREEVEEAMKRNRMLRVFGLVMLMMTLLLAGYEPALLPPASAEAGAGELPAFKEAVFQDPLQAGYDCNWTLTFKDSQEYLYTENGETLKKITTVDITATKYGGTNYFGEYIGEGTITVYNAVAYGDDAYPVYFGGQQGVSNQYFYDLVVHQS